MSIRVLIIDDDEEDFLIIKHFLSKIKSEEYCIDWCSDYDCAEGEISKDEHDIYLIDYFLGKGEGIDIIENVRKKNVLKPIILLTGAGNRFLDEKALEKGASDFLDKRELRSDTIERALRYALERYNQQRYIRNQERKYRSLFELSIEPFFILDDAFKIAEWNAAFVDVFSTSALPKSALKGKPFEALFKRPNDYTFFIEKLQKEGFAKGIKTVLFNGVRDIVCILSVSRLPRTSNHKNTGFHVALNDLSKIMEQEEELKKVDKLMMSGRMARMIAHEVRNPLTNIRLAVEELAEFSSEDEDVITLQKMIERNAQRIANLIDDLLKSARPMELEKQTTDLLPILQDAIELCLDRIELQNVKLIRSIPDTPIVGDWDPEKLKIALVNIITNAIEAMENCPSPELCIQLNCEPDDLVILIRDNGKGMDKETQRNLFDPLFTNRKGGLGLGMTTTLNIISMHEGKINVQSDEEKGTEFRIVLPVECPSKKRG